MLSASASPLPSPRSPSPAIEPASSSLLLTPEDKSSPRQTGGTPSDDSLLSELSFEYKKDDNGNYIRISKSKSPSLGAPGKYPKPERRSSPKTATDRSSLDALLALTERRDSDSLSESASATLAGPSQQPTASVLGVGSRPIQRTGSGSGVVSYITPLTHSTTLRSKLGASSIGRSGATRIGLGRAGRVSKEERAQQEERNRLADEELRAEAQRRLEEKENLLNGQAAEVLPAATDPEKRSSLPPQSLRASALVGASSSMSRSRSSGMGDSQRSSYPRGAGNARPVSRLRKDTFEEISEYSGSETQSADEFMLGLEAEAGEDPAPARYSPTALARGESYGDVDKAIELASSTRARPRRSLSVSGAPEEDPRQAAARKSSRPYAPHPPRSQSSLAISTNKTGARRVTPEEHMRQTKRAEQEAEYLRRQALLAESADVQIREPEFEEGYGFARQSPSSAHNNNQTRPTQGHQRRGSDTMRSLHSGSPTAVEALPPRLSPSGTGLKHRRNPTASEVPTVNGKNGKAQGRAYAGESKAKRYSAEDDPDNAVPAENNYAEPRQQGENQPSGPAPGLLVNGLYSDKRNIFVNKKAYAKLDLLGKGGSSKVYRVMTGANEIYAAKRVSLEHADAGMMNAYKNEISLLKRLAGNNRIIELIDSEVRKGVLYLVMECGEIDLAHLLIQQRKEPLNMVWIAYYWQQMLEAVQVIHEEKIVHSDLKPANFVMVKGQLKLIDFGIAKAIANDTTHIQRDTQLGTVNYMSPESLEVPEGMWHLKVGRASDVWSLGCILYQMVYGTAPFHALGMMQKMKAIPDPMHKIEYPTYSVPLLPPESRQDRTPPPEILEARKRRVASYAIASMQCCLCRNPKDRATIPDLLKHTWLSGQEPSEVSLRPDEAIIDPHYMKQLLAHGMGLAQARPNMTEAEQEVEAEALIKQLRAVHGHGVANP